MTTIDAATAHRRSLENLLEAQQYLTDCPQDELPAARLLYHVARLSEADARKLFVEALSAHIAPPRQGGSSARDGVSRRLRA